LTRARVDSITCAVHEADSPLWSVRAAAGRRLAAAAPVPEVFEVLHRLLLDPDDTGVTQETAEALIQRGDTYGLRVVLAALACAQSFSTADQLLAEIDCDPRWTTENGADQLVQQLRELASDEDDGVRGEAQSLLLRMKKPLGEADQNASPPMRFSRQPLLPVARTMIQRIT
jgi:HEAT repeat protein